MNPFFPQQDIKFDLRLNHYKNSSSCVAANCYLQHNHPHRIQGLSTKIGHNDIIFHQTLRT